MIWHTILRFSLFHMHGVVVPGGKPQDLHFQQLFSILQWSCKVANLVLLCPEYRCRWRSDMPGVWLFNEPEREQNSLVLRKIPLISLQHQCLNILRQTYHELWGHCVMIYAFVKATCQCCFQIQKNTFNSPLMVNNYITHTPTIYVCLFNKTKAFFVLWT